MYPLRPDLIIIGYLQQIPVRLYLDTLKRAQALSSTVAPFCAFSVWILWPMVATLRLLFQVDSCGYATDIHLQFSFLVNGSEIRQITFLDNLPAVTVYSRCTKAVPPLCVY